MNITVKGMPELQKILKNMPSKVEGAVHKEMKTIVEDLKGKAQLLTPVGETGDLQGSAFAEVEKLDGVTGFTSPYALKQHEELGFRHPKGGQAKFLETPYKENQDKYIEAIRKAAKGAVEK